MACYLMSLVCSCTDGDFLIIATTESPGNAIEIYSYCCEIESLFGSLKTKGFNFEDTHLAKPDRLAKLISIFGYCCLLGSQGRRVEK